MSFSVDRLSDDRDRYDHTLFLRNCMRASIGIPWASKVITGLRLFGNLNLALILLEMELRAKLVFGQFQIYWSVSMSLKHLRHVIVS